MRVLITGSTGYLGSRVVKVLREEDDVSVYGIDLNPPQDPDLYASFQTGSVTDSDTMKRLFAEAQPDVAVHLAFAVNPMHDRHREEYIDRQGTRVFLNECDRHTVERVVILSSVAAYGAFEDNDTPLTESSKVRGVHGYAYSWMKAETDRMAQAYQQSHPDCNVVILRPALFVGPHTHNAFFDVLKYPLVPQVRDKGVTRDPSFQFIHEDDMAACLAAAIGKKDGKGAYNISGEGTLKYSELVAGYGKKTLPIWRWLLKPIATLLWCLRISKVPADQLEFIRYEWIMDTTRMKRELYTPTVDSREAFKQFAEHKKNLSKSTN